MTLFRPTEKRFDDIASFPKWTGVLERAARELGTPPTTQREADWIAMLAAQQRVTDQLARAKAVQAFAETIPYVADEVNWDTQDYWETPREILAKSGDCEGAAILKYFSLRHLGVPAAHLRIAVGTVAQAVMHAVLGFKHDGDVLILDNLHTGVRPETAVPDFSPLFAVNEDHWFKYV